eukprot:5551295-Pyramimonas_sp.AAC.1
MKKSASSRGLMMLAPATLFKPHKSSTEGRTNMKQFACSRGLMSLAPEAPHACRGPMGSPPSSGPPALC